MYRLVEVNVSLSFIMHYKMCVVTHVVGKKHIVYKCYNERYTYMYNIFLNENK